MKFRFAFFLLFFICAFCSLNHYKANKKKLLKLGGMKRTDVLCKNTALKKGKLKCIHSHNEEDGIGFEERL